MKEAFVRKKEMECKRAENLLVACEINSLIRENNVWTFFDLLTVVNHEYVVLIFFNAW